VQQVDKSVQFVLLDLGYLVRHSVELNSVRIQLHRVSLYLFVSVLSLLRIYRNRNRDVVGLAHSEHDNGLSILLHKLGSERHKTTIGGGIPLLPAVKHHGNLVENGLAVSDHESVFMKP
jgi:hypothetical protein